MTNYNIRNEVFTHKIIFQNSNSIENSSPKNYCRYYVITPGLVLAALIVGASMLVRVETSFKIFGYPGLPLIFFLAAAIGGVVMIFNIILNDRKDRENSD